VRARFDPHDPLPADILRQVLRQLVPARAVVIANPETPIVCAGPE
jgi:hypothetical protein